MKERSYSELVDRIGAAASIGAARVDTLGTFKAGGESYPLLLVRLGEPGPGKLGVTISAGIHGDEPAGPEAAIRFILSARDDEKLLSRFHFTIFPCDNPSGWELNTRENADGIDLNREFAKRNPAPEVALITAALEELCFDLVFEMHEDIDAPGFYMYELAADPSRAVAPAIVEAVAARFPIFRSRSIEGRRASGGIIQPTLKRFRKSRLPKAVYTYQTCGGHVMTLEPPASVLPLEDRVEILLTGLGIALRAYG